MKKIYLTINLNNVKYNWWFMKKFNMIDEQKVIYEDAIRMAIDTLSTNEKNVLVVQGGPGTGKSVPRDRIQALPDRPRLLQPEPEEAIQDDRIRCGTVFPYGPAFMGELCQKTQHPRISYKCRNGP